VKRCAALVIVCIAAIATAAFAEARHRLVVVADDARLVHAIEAAVEPWDIEVVTALAAAPSGAHAAAEIAKAEHADAVTWTAGPAIWLYETRGARIVSREIPRVTQYDEASAAAVALSLKTLIRMGSLSPDAPASSVSAPWENADASASTSTIASTIASKSPAPRMVRGFAVEADVGARLFETDAQVAEPRLTIAAGAWIEHFGVFLSLSGGTGGGVSRAGLNGTFYDFGASLALRAAFETGRVRWMPGAGIGAHLAWLSASIATGPADVLRLDPSVDVELCVAYMIAARAWIGLRAGTSILLRRQQVFVNDAAAITFAPAMLDLGLRAAYTFP
jgi:hypothetical protein